MVRIVALLTYVCSGTELDPVTGEQLIQEFFRVGAPESPYKESLSPSPAPVQ